MKRPALFTLGLLAVVSAAQAATLDFRSDTLAAIEARYVGRPFILSVWSVNDCAYCLKEIATFGALAKSRPGLPLALVAIDTPEAVPQIDALLAQHGLADTPSWVFNDEIPERPRRMIDPTWRGELPRTYLYDAQHQRVAVSGTMDEASIRIWLKAHP
jgi:thiol-disulfide isomerase/thioredoxin